MDVTRAQRCKVNACINSSGVAISRFAVISANALGDKEYGWAVEQGMGERTSWSEGPGLVLWG